MPSADRVASPGARSAISEPRANEVPTIRMARHVSPAAVEEQIADNSEWLAIEPTVYFDLSDALYFDVHALLRILAVVAERRTAGSQTRFKLPNDGPARHILRLWRFPIAVSMASLTPFRLLVDPSDWDYFGEDWPKADMQTPAINPPQSVLAYLVDRQYFGLSAYGTRGPRTLERMIETETAHWRSYALSQLLASVLEGPTRDISRVLVREVLTNVAEHSAPTIAAIGSQLDLVPHAESGASPNLTISVWDDGPSIIKTLRECLLTVGTLRVRETDSVNNFAFEVQANGHQIKTYADDWVPSVSSTDPELLIASLYPAISSKASLAKRTRLPVDAIAEAGYGMFAVYRTAIDTFHGSMEIRTERTSIRVDRPSGTHPYRIYIESANDLPPMLGDIVTIRLPIAYD